MNSSKGMNSRNEARQSNWFTQLTQNKENPAGSRSGSRAHIRGDDKGSTKASWTKDGHLAVGGTDSAAVTGAGVGDPLKLTTKGTLPEIKQKMRRISEG